MIVYNIASTVNFDEFYTRFFSELQRYLEDRGFTVFNMQYDFGNNPENLALQDQKLKNQATVSRGEIFTFYHVSISLFQY